MKIEQIPKSQKRESERKNFVEKGNYTAINQILSFGIDEGDLHIHIAPSDDLGLGEKIGLVKDGFKELATIVENNPKVEEISATSWIVAKNPELLKKMGFRIDDSIKTNLRLSTKRVYQFRSRPLARAIMAREEFLGKYLEQ